MRQSCQTSQTRNEEKPCSVFFATSETSRAHDKYFILHILTLTVPSVTYILLLLVQGAKKLRINLHVKLLLQVYDAAHFQI